MRVSFFVKGHRSLVLDNLGHLYPGRVASLLSKNRAECLRQILSRWAWWAYVLEDDPDRQTELTHEDDERVNIANTQIATWYDLLSGRIGDRPRAQLNTPPLDLRGLPGSVQMALTDAFAYLATQVELENTPTETLREMDDAANRRLFCQPEYII